MSAKRIVSLGTRGNSVILSCSPSAGEHIAMLYIPASRPPRGILPGHLQPSRGLILTRNSSRSVERSDVDPFHAGSAGGFNPQV